MTHYCMKYLTWLNFRVHSIIFKVGKMHFPLDSWHWNDLKLLYIDTKYEVCRLDRIWDMDNNIMTKNNQNQKVASLETLTISIDFIFLFVIIFWIIWYINYVCISKNRKITNLYPIYYTHSEGSHFKKKDVKGERRF